MAKSRREKRPRERATPRPKIATPPAPKGPRAIAMVLLTFAAVFVALDVGSYTQKSATWDEPLHVTSGYVALARHDYRIDPEHPPFLRMWAALPLMAIQGIKLDTAIIDKTPPTMDWAMAKQFDFGHQFMYVDNDADRLLYAARFMVVVLGVVLGVLLFCWVNEWLGFEAAVVALAFYTIEPNIAAHSSLITTDFGVTCFIFGAVYFLWRTCRRPSALNITGLTAFFVLAIISKYSALILGPMVVLPLAFATLRLRTLKLMTALGILALLASTSWIAIWGVYGFRYTPSASDTWLLHFQDNPMVLQRVPALAGIVNWIDSRRLLPNIFTQGFLLGQAKAQVRGAFLAGDYSDVGWWYYFPVAFLIKTPVALIILLVGGMAAYVKRWRLWGLEGTVFVVLPVVLYLGTAMTARTNIGLRHILPIYPLVLLVAAAAAKELLASKRNTGRIVLGVLALCWVLEFGRAYPNNLAFFNQFVGGPANGFKYLVDSNLDWGQDLKPLKGWMGRNGVANINLAYFGSADPAYYHIDCTYLPGGPFFVADQSIRLPQLPGYVAASVTVLSGVYFDERGRAFYKALRDQEPLADIGHSIHVYWVERAWW